MKKILLSLSLTLFLLSGCYKAPKLTGFSQENWQMNVDECGKEKLQEAENLVTNFSEIKGSSQNEISLLLGKPERHELFERTQKFFFYQLTCPDSAGRTQQLRLRFDALGSLREGLVEIQ